MGVLEILCQSTNLNMRGLTCVRTQERELAPSKSCNLYAREFPDMDMGAKKITGDHSPHDRKILL